MKRYYAVGGQPIALRDAGGTFYLLTDHLGSVVAVLDATGAVVGEQRYRPFGQPRLTPGITQTDRGYTGQQSLAQAGLQDYNARWFDTSLGAFASSDSLVQYAYSPQALNRYSYVLNNPLTYSDPTGHRACEGPNGECWYTDPDPNIGTMPVQGWEPLPPADPVRGEQLEESDVTLLALTVYSEAQNGTWGDDELRLVAWVFLNRLSLETHESMWAAVQGSQSAVSCFYDTRLLSVTRCFGDPANALTVEFGGDPETWTLSVADSIATGSFAEEYAHVREVVEREYSDWLSYGTYSQHDPTAGMTDFAMISPEARYSGDYQTGGNELTQIWRASAWPGYRYTYYPEDTPLSLSGIGERYMLLTNKSLTIPPTAQ